MASQTVAIGLLGVQLDQPRGVDRWAAWRPSVAICQQEDLIVDRFELLYDRRFGKLAKQVVGDIQTVSPETEVVQRHLDFNDPWDFEEVYASLFEFCREYTFEPDREDYLIHITTGSHVAQICLFLLAESRHLPGKLIQTSPPPGRGRSKKEEAAQVEGSYQIVDLDLSRYDQLATRFAEERVEGQSFLKRGIATRDAAFNQLIDQIERVSLATKAPILLSGPTGSGKTQMAKQIYELKRIRRQVTGPLVEVNCATIRGDQAMSTLFGHTKGSFTGATSARAGLLKSADGGMLFLDEVGELGLDEQAMLLRAIEEKSFLPVGADKPCRSEFQLLAGTNRDLQEEVAGGSFREDLLARINLWSFRLPGLIDRRQDLDPNIDYELEQFARSSGDKVTMNAEARKRFLVFALDSESTWNANFRDLNAAITRMATLAGDGRITVADVTDEIARLKSSWAGTSTGTTRVVPRDTQQQLITLIGVEKTNRLDRFDRAQLADVLAACRASRSMAAAGRVLFQVSRKAKAKPNDSDRLRKYLARFDLTWDDVIAFGPEPDQ